MYLGIGTFWDVKDQELPVLFLLSFGIAGIMCNLLWRYQSLENLMLGSLLGGILLLLGRISNESIGYGDGLGIMILGIFEGVEGILPVVIGAFWFSGIYGVWRLLGLKSTGSDTMPFFPFLFIAFVGVKLL